jgi:hypothetical protein
VSQTSPPPLLLLNWLLFELLQHGLSSSDEFKLAPAGLCCVFQTVLANNQMDARTVPTAVATCQLCSCSGCCSHFPQHPCKRIICCAATWLKRAAVVLLLLLVHLLNTAHLASAGLWCVFQTLPVVNQLNAQSHADTTAVAVCHL